MPYVSPAFLSASMTPHNQQPHSHGQQQPGNQGSTQHMQQPQQQPPQQAHMSLYYQMPPNAGSTSSSGSQQSANGTFRPMPNGSMPPPPQLYFPHVPNHQQPVFAGWAYPPGNRPFVPAPYYGGGPSAPYVFPPHCMPPMSNGAFAGVSALAAQSDKDGASNKKRNSSATSSGNASGGADASRRRRFTENQARDIISLYNSERLSIREIRRRVTAKYNMSIPPSTSTILRVLQNAGVKRRTISVAKKEQYLKGRRGTALARANQLRQEQIRKRALENRRRQAAAKSRVEAAIAAAGNPTNGSGAGSSVKSNSVGSGDEGSDVAVSHEEHYDDCTTDAKSECSVGSSAGSSERSFSASPTSSLPPRVRYSPKRIAANATTSPPEASNAQMAAPRA